MTFLKATEAIRRIDRQPAAGSGRTMALSVQIRRPGMLLLALWLFVAGILISLQRGPLTLGLGLGLVLAANIVMLWWGVLAQRERRR